MIEEIMKRKIILPFVMLILAMPFISNAFDGDAWIVTGDKVLMRKSPTVSAPVVTEMKAGTVVRVTGKSDKRDKVIPNDEYGFFWYQSVLPDGRKGWVYGKFLYQMNSEDFVTNPELLQKEYTIGGKKYYFGVAIDEAYPVADDQGLTGSEIHGLPFFVEEDGKVALLLRSESVRTFWDQKPPYYFKTYNSEGGIQQVSSIETTGKGGVVKLTFEYSTQDSGGTFTITAKLVKGYLLISDYKKEESPRE
jgi:hypothetical protein